MKIILLDKIAHLGAVGDQVEVKSGFARNFLIPQKKAVMATKENIAYFESQRAELEAKALAAVEAAQARAEQITTLEKVTLSSKAGEEGRLFGSIGSKDIADAITKANVVVAKNEVRLPKGALRTLGEHNIEIQLHSDVFATIIVDIIAE